MKQSNIENLNPADLHKFLMQSARDNFEENRSDFNAGMAMMMGLVKKYFCNDFDIAIRDNNGWNSVDEELPKQKGNYLIYCFDRFDEQYEIQIEYFSGKYFITDPDADVLYWQPLPKPPKE